MKQAIRQVLLFDLLSEVGGNGSPGAILVATGRMLGKPNSAAIPPLQHGPSQALACELGSSVRAASTRASPVMKPFSAVNRQTEYTIGNDYDPDGELPADTRPVSAYLTYVGAPRPIFQNREAGFPQARRSELD